MEDCEKILGKLGFRAVFFIVENQEFSTVLCTQVLEQFKPESDKTVSVGNHNREFISPQKASQ